jgi:hypothetical protein
VALLSAKPGRFVGSFRRWLRASASIILPPLPEILNTHEAWKAAMNEKGWKDVVG